MLLELQRQTLSLIKNEYKIETLKTELEQLSKLVSHKDKITLLTAYVSLSNLHEIEFNYEDHCRTHETCLKEVVSCLKKNINKCRPNGVCCLIIDVYTFNLNYISNKKVIQLIA